MSDLREDLRQAHVDHAAAGMNVRCVSCGVLGALVMHTTWALGADGWHCHPECPDIGIGKIAVDLAQARWVVRRG